VRRAVVALTKIDMVDSSLIGLVSEELGELLAPTSLAGAPICPVSSRSGDGLEALKETILRLAREIPITEPALPFRMAIDRAFVVQGRGTVVTGSVLRGTVAGGDTLQLCPGGKICRVRDLQSHGTADSHLARGQRAALNLGGVDREDVERGMELATPGFLTPSKLLDVRLQCLTSGERTIRHSTRVRLEMGTREVVARLVLYGVAEISGGQAALAQLRCRQPVTATYGQRFILRDESASRTLGGGIVLRPVGIRKRLQRLLTLATAQGDLVSIDGAIYLHADREAEMRRVVGDLIGKQGGATVAQIRETLQSSRKFVVPFVEYLDRIRFTKRDGDLRTLSASP
jgi:selenocysteine-specific elongation factor